MPLSWEIIESSGLPFSETDQLGLSWAKLDLLSDDEIIAIAKTRITALKDTDEPLPAVIQRELQVFLDTHPELIPKKEPLTYRAVKLLLSRVITAVASHVINNGQEILRWLMSIIENLFT